jgi:hypothetical protein
MSLKYLTSHAKILDHIYPDETSACSNIQEKKWEVF